MTELAGRLKYLLTQYTNRTATQSEEQELFQLLDDAGNDEQVKRIMMELLAEETPEELHKAQWEPLIRNILDGAQGAHPEEAPVYPLEERRSAFNWKTMAAAAVLVLLGAGIFYFAFDRNEGEKVAMKQQVTLPARDITPPSSTNAILTLGNGQVIVLDSAGEGTLAQQGAVKVVKLADGQIAYDGQGGNGAAQGEILYNTLSNPAGSKVVHITLSDGTRVWLNSKSSVRYPTAFSGTARKVEITGEAYFEVARKAAPAAGSRGGAVPFVVRANEVDIEVLGTHFNVNSFAEDGAVRTTLLEGSVRVNKEGEAVLLKPGQQAQVNLSKEGRTTPEAIKVNTPDLEAVMAWKNGRFAYQNTDLETIMRQMARWYDVEVVYEDKITDRYTVNVSRNVPASQLFQFIEMSGGVRFSIEGRKVTVKR